MDPIIYLNRKYLKLSQAKISPLDRGFMYGDGLFESLRTYNQKVFKLKEHLARLYAGAKKIKLKIPIPQKELAEAVKQVNKFNSFPASFIKIIITRGVAQGFGVSIQPTLKPTVIVTTQKLPPILQEIYTKGWKVTISSFPKNTTSKTTAIKSLNYLDAVLARGEANKVKAQEAIFLNSNGYVAEGTTSNIFIIKKGMIFTPPVAAGALAGITRQTVIDLAKKLKIPLKEKLFKKRELLQADEVFLTFTSAGIVPVANFGSQKARKITTTLIEAFNAWTQSY